MRHIERNEFLSKLEEDDLQVFMALDGVLSGYGKCGYSIGVVPGAVWNCSFESSKNITVEFSFSPAGFGADFRRNEDLLHLMNWDLYDDNTHNTLVDEYVDVVRRIADGEAILKRNTGFILTSSKLTLSGKPEGEWESGFGRFNLSRRRYKEHIPLGRLV